MRFEILAGHSTHNNVLLGDSRVQIIHGHLGAFQRAEDRLPQTKERYRKSVNSRAHFRQTTRKAQRKPPWTACHNWAPLIMPPSPYAREWNLSSSPKYARPFRAKPLPGRPFTFHDPPGSDGAFSLKPSRICSVELDALSSVLLAALCCITRHSALSAALFSLFACELSEGRGHWILVCSFVKQGWQRPPQRHYEDPTGCTQHTAHPAQANSQLVWSLPLLHLHLTSAGGSSLGGSSLFTNVRDMLVKAFVRTEEGRAGAVYASF